MVLLVETNFIATLYVEKTPLIRSEAAGSGKWITQLQGATELWRKRRMR